MIYRGISSMEGSNPFNKEYSYGTTWILCKINPIL